jgi:predicted cupin superfamily sugar epimerase
MLTAQRIIELLELRPLPREGGWYRETYRAGLHLPALGRDAATAIYYLLTPDSFSSLHRLRCDEVFHFYQGDPVEILQLDPATRTGRVLTLGNDLLDGQRPQAVVPQGVWQASRLRPGGAFALLGTTTAPGFDFADFEPGSEALAADFPDFADRIRGLCPPTGQP